MSRVPPGLRVAPESPRASFGLPEICSFHPGLMDQEDLMPGFHRGQTEKSATSDLD